MQLSAAGAAFLRHGEGFVDHYYLDVTGTGTIGVGFTWASGAFRKWWEANRKGKFGPGAKMTRAEADKVLQLLADEEYGAAINTFLGRKTVPQHVWDGSFSPVFNLGTGSLRWKWAAAVKAGDFVEAARLLRTTGTTSKGRKLQGLVNRRKEEAELIALGDYTVGKVAADPLDDGVLVRGERGAPVLELQQALAALGIYKGAIDGKFGHGTEAAVLEFQRAHDLSADGWAGPKTLAAIAAARQQPDAPSAKPTQPEPETPASEPPARSIKNGIDLGCVGIALAILAALVWAGVTILT